MSKDTITVELPIEARSGGYVSVAGFVSASRDRWREIATDLAGASVGVTALAPAVVAWIERGEFKPLDLPEVGRRIKATLRDGYVETFKVSAIEGASAWARVWNADANGGFRFIQRVRDVDDPSPDDIISWEYVDEPAISAESPTFGDLAEVFRNWSRQGVTLASIEYVLNREYPEAANRQPAISNEQAQTMVETVARELFISDRYALVVLAQAWSDAGLSVAGESDG